jgi:type II secretory pathway component PulJ
MTLFQLLKISPAAGKTVGFSLVEILLALVLLGFVTVAMSTFLVKGNAISSAMSQRYREATEAHSVILDIQQDLAQGAYISDNSHTNRLEYTTYDSSGNAFKKIYRITTISSMNYLQLSTDGGTTWGSPYRISLYTQYKLTGTPLFLYAQDANNCTSFVDSNANGV